MSKKQKLPAAATVEPPTPTPIPELSGLTLALDSNWDLLIQLPSGRDGSPGQTFQVKGLGQSPTRDARAMATLLRLLQEQALATGRKVPPERRQAATVGTVPSPTVTQIENWMKTNHAKISAQRVATPKAAEELGL